MNKLVVECYCANFENYPLFDQIMAPLRGKGIGVELSIFDDAAYNRRLMAQKDNYLGDYVTFHGPHVGVEAASPKGSAAHTRIVQAYDRAFDIYNAFGAHAIVIHTNQLSFRPEEKALLMAQSIATLNQILDMAKARNVELLVENVGWQNADSMLFDEDEFIALFDQLRPWAGCLIDTGHAMINRWDLDRVIGALAPKIAAYHLHNNDGERDIHRPMYEEGLFYGAQDIARLAAVMEKHTPGADWILEYAPGDHITPRLIAGECDKILSLLK